MRVPCVVRKVNTLAVISSLAESHVKSFIRIVNQLCVGLFRSMKQQLNQLIWDFDLRIFLGANLDFVLEPCLDTRIVQPFD